MTATSRQGSVKPFTLIEGPAAWYTKDYAGTTKHVYFLTPSDIAELDTAVQSVVAAGLDIKDASKDSFPLPTFGPKLKEIQHEVSFGRGFALLKGVPVDRYSRQESLIAYWLMGQYWGKAVPQNQKGHVIGHIKDIGHDPSKPETRLYATSVAQPWHNDGPADLVALLCLKAARQGGSSGWSSSITVYNEILKRAPELANVLADPNAWYFDRKGEIPPGKKGFYPIPVFNFFHGHLSVNYSDNYYFLSQRHPEVPRLTEQQLQAIKLFNELAASPELAMDYVLQPGDVQLLSNHTCLHYRSAFEDYDDINEKRHLLRLWLTPEEERPLPHYYEEIQGSTEIGKRGGIRTEGQVETISLEAE
mmetsp:Transcript_37065/g.82427  ORF Transcript_37065/g.82427 Transcript_37065/m.82427 type:complete len:361 (+) Transcript_37065:175-1257(+)|eukprot:CAMPEP_0202898256 /NCGR_PEP_ID=MMETSP1392-20130828/6818_1 /ASSEMBLY_ACC=CAM_ASM_000868 /TAXON_ID=225041 /ORGANISM="Chlamydomonas chlamydogama, Strain SAG 11-48b" /LENGTH=360 /DNA_ID=CAMNT_0049584127 /DNA_START=168 /DNA_END=1250 /DNA_ORIENTATION=-